MSDIEERITAYLTGGGLFNSEIANHDAVRDLLIDCRTALRRARSDALEEALATIDLKDGWQSTHEVHSAIRALKEKQP